MPKMTSEILLGSSRPSDVSDEGMGFKFGIPQITALDYIKRLGLVPKVSVREPHEWGMGRISLCSSNFARHKREPFLDHFGTADEKWTVHKRVVRRNAEECELIVGTKKNVIPIHIWIINI
ncbi:UNVERIFIED_CONTAM: hypothetical protein NCL1_25674 [Trichonephila clavipes]